MSVRDSIGSTIYFSTYESAKQLLVKFQGSDSPTSPLSVAISGGLCGTAGWICVRSTPFSSLLPKYKMSRLNLLQTYPIDTAKTQYQKAIMFKTKGQRIERPRIDYFHFVHYRGEYGCIVPSIHMADPFGEF